MDPVTCPNCGHNVAEPDAASCPACGMTLDTGHDARMEAPAGPPGGGAGGGAGGAPPASGSSIPFDDPSLPFFERFLLTAKMAFTNPMELFSAMPGGDIGMPLLYGVLVGTVTVIFSIVWNMMFSGMALLGGGVPAGEFAISTGLYVLVMFLSPMFVAIGLFISAAIYHVALMILGSADRGFAVTFRAVAYGNTPNLLAVLPICGGLIGGIWAVVLIIIAGKQGHETEWWKAILAYFLPTIVCCCLIFWLASMFGFVGALSD